MPARARTSTAAAPRHTAAVRKRLENQAAGRVQGCDPATCEREYTVEELEFLKAVDRYKREKRRPFPTACEMLKIAVALGYRRVVEPGG